MRTDTPTRHPFVRDVVHRVVEGISIGSGRVVADRFELTKGLIRNRVCIRFRVLDQWPERPEPDHILQGLCSTGLFSADPKWRPEPFFVFTFTSGKSVERNVEALKKFVCELEPHLAAVEPLPPAQFNTTTY